MRLSNIKKAGICIVSLAALQTGIVAFAEADQVATPDDTTRRAETAFSIDRENHVISNANDGTFVLEYAEDEDYFVGYAEDKANEVAYVLVTYEDEYYLVIADYDKYLSDYSGKYDDSFFVDIKDKGNSVSTYSADGKNKKELQPDVADYDEDNSIVNVEIKDEEKELGDTFIYTGTYSVSPDGWFCGLYYVDQDFADGIVDVDGVKYFFKDGKVVPKELVEFEGNKYYTDAFGKIVKATWVTVDKVEMYFDGTGKNIRNYYGYDYSETSRRGTCEMLSKGKWSNVTEGAYLVGDSYYYFRNGKHYTGTTWVKYNNSYHLYINQGKCIHKLTNYENTYQYWKLKGSQWIIAENEYAAPLYGMSFYFGANGLATVRLIDSTNSNEKYRNTIQEYKNESWTLVQNKMYQFNSYYYFLDEYGKFATNIWKTSNNVRRYFDAKGSNSRIYYEEDYDDEDKAGTLEIFTNGAYTTVQKGAYIISGDYMYFEEGKRVTGDKFVLYGSNYYINVTKGLITEKVAFDGNKYTLYSCVNNKFVSKSGAWFKTSTGIKMYFCANGYASRCYLARNFYNVDYTGTVWDYDISSDKWTKLTGRIASVDNGYVWLNSAGSQVDVMGWKDYADKSVLYVNDKGLVTEYVSYNPTTKITTYKTGEKLALAPRGVRAAKINGDVVYYYPYENGVCYVGEATVGGFAYVFNEYGYATERKAVAGLSWDNDVWMSRVFKKYLGTNSLYCNTFTNLALALIGGDNVASERDVRFKDQSSGGILATGSPMIRAWRWGTVYGKLTYASNGAWVENQNIVLNKNIVDFNYNDLEPGDLIIYEQGGDTTHISLYIGKFSTVDSLKTYLKNMGVSDTVIANNVKTWGGYYEGNDSAYWCIEGGMGSNNSVYICNNCYLTPGSGNSYATKIVKLNHAIKVDNN